MSADLDVKTPGPLERSGVRALQEIERNEGGGRTSVEQYAAAVRTAVILDLTPVFVSDTPLIVELFDEAGELQGTVTWGR